MNAILDNEVKYIRVCSMDQKGVQIFIFWDAGIDCLNRQRKNPEKHAFWTGYVVIFWFCVFFQLPFQHQIIISVIHWHKQIVWMGIF